MTNDVKIQRGTPREKREVTNDKEWLEDRMERLDKKIEVLSERVKAAKQEKNEREKQLAAL